MVITNAQTQDSGSYSCICYTEEGQQYATEYELNIEEAPARKEMRPPKVEHADVGSTVVLRCNADRYPAKFSWTRQHGNFASGQDVTSVSLRFNSTLSMISYFDFLRVNFDWLTFKRRTLEHTFVQQTAMATLWKFQQH